MDQWYGHFLLREGDTLRDLLALRTDKMGNNVCMNDMKEGRKCEIEACILNCAFLKDREYAGRNRR